MVLNGLKKMGYLNTLKRDIQKEQNIRHASYLNTFRLCQKTSNYIKLNLMDILFVKMEVYGVNGIEIL